jgi:hypothetical protein
MATPKCRVLSVHRCVNYTSDNGQWHNTRIMNNCSSSSIGTATLVGFGLLNYRWVFLAGRFLQSAVASGTSNPQLGVPVIRTFHPPPPGVPHVWNDANEPQQRKVELWARNFREFCRKWRLPRHFWVILHAVNLRHGTDGFPSPPKEGALRIFSPEKSDRVWTRELGNQRSARSPLDHRSRCYYYYYCYYYYSWHDSSTAATLTWSKFYVQWRINTVIIFWKLTYSLIRFF